ncbi:MAG: hypothetical protein KC593_21055 [Myxococcales bacterium]|nr:hypothetical protein [Myxococcales bacterium]
MRLATFVCMAVLAVISVTEDQLTLALAFAGVKALLVGVGYMELRSAARIHMVTFSLAMLALAAGLVLTAS